MPPRRRVFRIHPGLGLVALVLSLGTFAVPSANAHRVSSVSLISYLDTEKRTYTLDAAMEVVPSEDPAVNDQISPEDAAREFAAYLVVMFDEAEQKPEMEISVEETSDENTPEELRRRQVLTKLKGTFPESAKEFLLYLDPRCPMAVVMVVVKDEQPSRRMQVILAGEYSRPVSVLPVEEGDPFAEGAKAEDSPAPEDSGVAGASDRASDAVKDAASRGTGGFDAGWRAFFADSMLPFALVLALLLISLERKPLLWQAAFLLAGTGLAISLALWSLVPAAPWAVRALALSVAVLAIEAALHGQVKSWRFGLAGVGGAALGLFLAGTGSARAFLGGTEPLLGQGIGFLLGAEVAAIAILLVGAATLLGLSRFPWFRKAVVLPLAVLLAGYAIFATVEVWL